METKKQIPLEHPSHVHIDFRSDVQRLLSDTLLAVGSLNLLPSSVFVAGFFFFFPLFMLTTLLLLNVDSSCMFRHSCANSPFKKNIVWMAVFTHADLYISKYNIPFLSFV